MLPDSIMKIGSSQVQHGPASDRVYLMKLDDADMPDIVDRLDDLACEMGYTKIFAKIPAAALPWFRTGGFVTEAYVPRMYRGESAGCFMSRYLAKDRAVPGNEKLICDVLDVAEDKACSPLAPAVDCSEVRRMGPEDAEKMAEVYAEVFESYPFPITDPGFIRESMEDDVAFYGVMSERGIEALASAEKDSSWLCAEMTDFATLPGNRGKGLAGKLLARMESDLAEEGYCTAYTIARAWSFGMNAVFARAGYRHAGVLPNNTQIGGTLESMNVWHKQISAR